MGTALVVGLLVAMCGGIAYVGDLLGRRMGKKRLSLLGLRPRHTAVVFTVVTGMVIAGVMLAVLVLASQGVRIALTRGEKLLYENHRLKRERRQLDQLNTQLATRNLQLVTNNSRLTEANQDLSRHNVMLRRDESRLKQETQLLQTQNQALHQRNQLLATHNTTLLTLKRQLKFANTDLRRQNKKLDAENGTLAKVNHHLNRTNQHLAQANLELARTSQKLTSRNDQLGQQNKRLQTRLAGLQQAESEAEGHLKELHRDLGNAERVVREQNQWWQRGKDLALGQVIVHYREELARQLIPAGASEVEVRAALRRLLEAADHEVARREGRPLEHSHRVCVDDADASPDQAFEQTVRALITASQAITSESPGGPNPEAPQLVVRALACQNVTDQGSAPLGVEIDAQVNRLAFHQGEEIAELPSVATAATRGELLQRLVAFLQGPVREAAEKRSVRSEAGARASEIDYETLLDVVTKIKRMPRRVRVGAIAASDTWTADPLHVDFFVVPATTRVAAEKREQ